MVELRSSKLFSLKKGSLIAPISIVDHLVSLGYKRQNKILEVGDFAVLGGVVDIWLEHYNNPVRFDFLGNTLEQIFLFSLKEQKKIREIEEVFIVPFKAVSNKKVKWPKKDSDQREKLFFSEIKLNDLVVHIDHGLGKFIGITILHDQKEESLAIEYARGDKLYVPVSQIDRVTKYIGIPGRRSRLNSLGTATWERVKKEVEHSVINIAKDLLAIYAVRETAYRPPFSKDTLWQKQLEESFEFQLTEDQERALKEIKEDLEKNMPMDRLLVGDVGFGKTELAVRAAFKVVQDGYQVAILVPTTILAEQHLHVFRERLEDFPVRIATLSKFKSAENQKEIIKNLQEGRVDIVIGTHRLLSQAIEFKSLGLVVIDEEHRFGVVQKEKFKRVRSQVDVLSLSATPIPRTLHMALTKIRAISVLYSPPKGRVPIETFVGETQEGILREAVLKETALRGQVYYVHNRVRNILDQVRQLRELFPELIIDFAHGQMKETLLDKVIDRFLNKQIDILVCTNIIGSGLDVPNANTIIVNDAQRFGLADLHQLRGRVGRSDKKAYAYFLYPKQYLPKGKSLERLLAIREASALGSGFVLAAKDLEIRGAGNLLGKEQHGNVSLVGFELYCQLLTRAVENLKSR
ncbi:MAG: DEAD/DEAH box helicase [Patescibacteria group bacterium]|nr:DEAD/DEAH box helicase [Patescibacteria group bacterium]